MRLARSFISALCFLAITVYADGPAQDTSSLPLAYLDSFKTVGEAFDSLKDVKLMTSEQHQSLKTEFEKRGIPWELSLPPLTLEGRTVKWGAAALTIEKDQIKTSTGLIIRTNQAPEKVFALILDHLAGRKKEKFVWRNLVLPQAFADDEPWYKRKVRPPTWADDWARFKRNWSEAGNSAARASENVAASAGGFFVTVMRGLNTVGDVAEALNAEKLYLEARTIVEERRRQEKDSLRVRCDGKYYVIESGFAYADWNQEREKWYRNYVYCEAFARDCGLQLKDLGYSKAAWAKFQSAWEILRRAKSDEPLPENKVYASEELLLKAVGNKSQNCSTSDDRDREKVKQAYIEMAEKEEKSVSQVLASRLSAQSPSKQVPGTAGGTSR